MTTRTFLYMLAILSILLSGMASARAEPVILYVKPGTSGDCSSWQAPCELEKALSQAGAGVEIWVAQGTYHPDTAGLAEPREATFQLKSGVAIYGGFVGNETDRLQRSHLIHHTFLSGDLLGNDGAGFANSDENTYHVVTGSGTDATAILDGFTIQGGNANGINAPHDQGGGMLNITGSPTLANIEFSSNKAKFGGGMADVATSSPSLTNVTFTGNMVSANGGGLYNGNASSPSLNRVIFMDNSADKGGGIYNDASSPALVNVTFTGNWAYYGGGICNFVSISTLTNVSLSANAAYYGGGIYNITGGTLTLVNSIVWDNTAEEDMLQISGFANITYSDIQGGWNGLGNIASDPLFVDAAGGNLRLLPGSLAIDAGSPTICPATDQRGVPRPIDGDWKDGPRCDMGALEFEPLKVFLPLVRR